MIGRADIEGSKSNAVMNACAETRKVWQPEQGWEGGFLGSLKMKGWVLFIYLYE